MTAIVESSATTAVALRGEASTIAISPNVSSGPSSKTWPFAMRSSTRPETTPNISSPEEPSSKITVPAGSFTCLLGALEHPWNLHAHGSFPLRSAGWLFCGHRLFRGHHLERVVTPVAARSPQGERSVNGPAPGTAEWGVTDTQSQLSDAERADRLDKLQGIMDLMRPAVQADGGDLVLVRADVEAGVIEVQLQGACSSCAISSATLSGGVERILRERLPWVTEVLGGVDDSLSIDESAALGSGGYVPSL